MVLNKILTYDVLNVEGNPKVNSTISINWKVAEGGAKHLIHKTLVIQTAQRRQGTVSCKTRSEVVGGGRKPWKQKGTGRARSGSANSPLWRGGGVAFGPKPRKFDKKVNFKEKRLALTTALCATATKTIIVEDLFTQLPSPSTKGLCDKLKNLGIQNNRKLLFISHDTNRNLSLSIRNIPNYNLFSPKTLHLKEILSAQTILITEKALSELNQI